jgi:glycosyltransferase involved in cell wall biosynthesis
VRSALGQAGVDVEVVVSLDGDDPALAEALAALRDPRVRVVTHPAGGRSAARNRGLAVARHPLVAFLDDDDRLLPGGLAARVQALERHPQAVLVYGRPAVMDAQGREVAGSRRAAAKGRETCLDRHREQWLGRSLLPSTVLLRREVVERAGGFDEDLPTGEDWVFFLRAADVGPFVFLPVPTVLYRRHAGQVRGDPESQEAALPRWTGRYFDDPRTPPAARRYRRRLEGRHLNWIARNHRRRDDAAAARRCFEEAVRRDPSLLLHPRRFARWIALRVRPRRS